jgi:hypothetical protein
VAEFLSQGNLIVVDLAVTRGVGGVGGHGAGDPFFKPSAGISFAEADESLSGVPRAPAPHSWVLADSSQLSARQNGTDYTACG